MTAVLTVKSGLDPHMIMGLGWERLWFGITLGGHVSLYGDLPLWPYPFWILLLLINWVLGIGIHLVKIGLLKVI